MSKEAFKRPLSAVMSQIIPMKHSVIDLKPNVPEAEIAPVRTEVLAEPPKPKLNNYIAKNITQISKLSKSRQSS